MIKFNTQNKENFNVQLNAQNVFEPLSKNVNFHVLMPTVHTKRNQAVYDIIRHIKRYLLNHTKLK